MLISFLYTNNFQNKTCRAQMPIISSPTEKYWFRSIPLILHTSKYENQDCFDYFKNWFLLKFLHYLCFINIMLFSSTFQEKMMFCLTYKVKLFQFSKYCHDSFKIKNEMDGAKVICEQIWRYEWQDMYSLKEPLHIGINKILFKNFWGRKKQREALQRCDGTF